jgi:serine/threonine-protein kinase
MPASTPEILKSYDVVAKLREGGMGAIYRVRHRLLEQERVVKILRPQMAGDSDFRARFLREAQLVARLRHPNLALLHEFALAESGAGCIVMEFIDGLSLKDVLETSGPPNAGLVIEIARQALDALGYLHRGGILHRDISTDNLMLTRDHDGAPLVKLIDLGIAKRTGESTQTKLTATGAFLGKVRYASPEQFGGDLSALDARSDLYSLGVVLYELSTGAFPIAGEDANSLIAGHLFQPPRPFAQTDPEGHVPEALRGVVLRALAKDRAQRFQSAAEFAAALAPLGRQSPWDPAELDRILALAPPAPTGGGEDLSAALSTVPAAAGTTDQGSTVRLAPAEAAAAAPAAATVLLPDGQTRRRRRRGAWIAAAALVAAVAGVAAWRQWWPGVTGAVSPGDDEAQAGAAEPEEAIVRAALAKGRAYALVIGNGAYQHQPPLPSAIGDAEAVGDLLAARYGFVVRRLADATRAQILGALEELERQLGAEDRLLVYYAGHGGLELTPPRADAEPEAIGYWLPVDAAAAGDANVIPNSEIAASLKGMQARHVLIVADSCYAGTIGLERLLAEPAPASAQERRRELERLVGSRARLALTSGGTEPVPERPSGRSVFADALLRVLAENRGVLRSKDLIERVRPLVEDASLRRTRSAQTPTLGVIPDTNDDRGEFFFVPSATAATPPEAAS